MISDISRQHSPGPTGVGPQLEAQNGNRLPFFPHRLQPTYEDLQQLKSVSADVLWEIQQRRGGKRSALTVLSFQHHAAAARDHDPEEAIALAHDNQVSSHAGAKPREGTPQPPRNGSATTRSRHEE